MYIVKIETMKIQGYIFGTNKLKEISGASYLVKYVTGDLVLNKIKELNLKGNCDLWNSDLENVKFFSENIDYEIIYLGGGNGLILFKNENNADNFIKNWSRSVIEKAPGLQFVAVKEKFEKNKLKEKVTNMNNTTIDEAKNNVDFDSRFETSCFFERSASTGVRANYKIKDIKKEKFISDITNSKLEVLDKSKEVLAQDLDLEKNMIPDEFDEFGHKEGFNYIAVLHSDGNNIGQKIIDLWGDEKSNVNDTDYIKKIRKFSLFMDEINKRSIKESLKILCKEISKFPEYENIIGKRKKGEDNHSLYPFRPVIYGGDDLTIVIKGEYGLRLAEIYSKKIAEISKLSEYEKIIGKRKKGISVCTGISITHTSYPFSKSYEIAEELISNAKRVMKEDKKLKGEGYAVDWHIETGSILTDIEEMRNYNYQIDGKSLTFKPYYFCTNDSKRSFNKFKKSLKILSEIPQSKYKEIIKLLRYSVKHFQEFMNIDATNYEKNYEQIKTQFKLHDDFFVSLSHKDENKMQSTPLVDLIETVKFYSKDGVNDNE
jgi:hypothetical protein